MIASTKPFMTSSGRGVPVFGTASWQVAKVRPGTARTDRARVEHGIRDQPIVPGPRFEWDLTEHRVRVGQGGVDVARSRRVVVVQPHDTEARGRPLGLRGEAAST